LKAYTVDDKSKFHGFPRISDLLDDLPDQQKIRQTLLQHSKGAENTSTSANLTLPIDGPASITVDLIAIVRSCLPQFAMPVKSPDSIEVEPWCWIDKKLIWASANCLIAGFNLRNGADISRSIVALVYITEYARLLSHDLVHEVVIALHPHGWDRLRLIARYALTQQGAWTSISEDLENAITLLFKLVQAANHAQNANENWSEVEDLHNCHQDLLQTRGEIRKATLERS
jgi:hypothetical protein